MTTNTMLALIIIGYVAIGTISLIFITHNHRYDSDSVIVALPSEIITGLWQDLKRVPTIPRILIMAVAAIFTLPLSIIWAAIMLVFGVIFVGGVLIVTAIQVRLEPVNCEQREK